MQRQRQGESHVNMEAEIRVTQLQAKEHKGLLVTTRSMDEKEDRVSPIASRKNQRCQHLQTSSLQICDRVIFSCFRAPWFVVICHAGLGNEYTWIPVFSPCTCSPLLSYVVPGERCLGFRGLEIGFYYSFS